MIVLISGHPVIYDECYNSLSNIDFDYKLYSHIWWDDDYMGKFYKMHFSEKCESYSMSSKFLEKFNPNDYIIDQYKKFDTSFVKFFNAKTFPNSPLEFYRMMTPIIIYGMLSQTYSVRQSFLLSKNEKSDIYIKTRSDVIHTKNIREIISKLDLSSNKVFFQSSMMGGHLYSGEFPNNPCDWFFVGNKEVMNVITEKWHSGILEHYKNGVIHTNDFLKIICKESHIDFELVDFGAIIYKQSNDYYDRFHNKIDYYYENFDFVENRPLNIENWPLWIDMVNFAHFKNINFN
jgi:hypothetical protein